MPRGRTSEAGDRGSRIRLNVAVRFASFGGAVLILLVVVSQLAASCAYAVVALGLERRLVPHELAPRRMSGLVEGALCGAAGLLAAYGLIVALGGYRPLPPDGAETPGILELMMVAGLGTAVTEELVFGGIGLRLLEEFVGAWAAIVVSGLEFIMIHLTNPDATPWAGIAIEAGLLLGVLYVLTRPLWVVSGYHMLWNIVQGPVLGSRFRTMETWPRSDVRASRAPIG